MCTVVFQQYNGSTYCSIEQHTNWTLMSTHLKIDKN